MIVFDVPFSQGEIMVDLKRLTTEELQMFRQLRLASVTTDDRTLITTVTEEQAKSDADLTKILMDEHVLAAFHDGIAVGMVTLGRHQLERRSHAAEVHWLFVSPAYRCRGIAKTIMQAVEEEAVDAAIECLELHVVADNRVAIGLYQSLGYKEYGILPKAVKQNGQYVDGIFMAKFL